MLWLICNWFIGGSLSSTLRAVAVPIITDEKCREAYEDNMVADSMLCAGYDEGGKDSCQVKQLCQQIN